MIQIFGHVKCRATKAAQRFFSERRVEVQFVDILQKNLSKGELQSVIRALGGVNALYDSEGSRVKERGLQHLGPDDARKVELLLEDGRLYRTPIVRNGAKATIRLAEATWKEWLTHGRV